MIFPTSTEHAKDMAAHMFPEDLGLALQCHRDAVQLFKAALYEARNSSGEDGRRLLAITADHSSKVQFWHETVTFYLSRFRN